MKYTLIGSHKHFDDTSAIHISKQPSEINPMCGRFLGFNFAILTDDNVVDSNLDTLYARDEILNRNPTRYNQMCKTCMKVLSKYDNFGNSKPVQISIGEWWFNGHFIQEQDHPSLPKFISYPSDVEYLVSTHSSLREATEYCLLNPVANPPVYPKDFLY